MSTSAISQQQVRKQLSQWYNALIRYELGEAERLRKEIGQKISGVEGDRTLLLYYSLLNFRHSLLNEDQVDLHNYATSIEPFKEQVGPLLTHYYHLFTGIYQSYEGKYAEALQHYIIAEENLNQIPDDIEKGEFHYRVATVYYHTRQTMLAFKHVQQAKNIFDADDAYLQKSADCENLYSLCCILNKDFTLAVDHLNRALNISKTLGDEELELYIHYNFGFLFAEKGEPHQAIQHLKKVEAAGLDLIRTSFLLARELFKVDRRDEAFKKISTGLEACNQDENIEYKYHFELLKAFHDDSEDMRMESIVKEGVAFFKKHQLHGFVNDYLTRLVDYYFEKGNYQKASAFFQEAQDYRKLGQMG